MKKWLCEYSAGVNFRPDGRLFSFDFPASTGHVNLVTRNRGLFERIGAAIGATFTISGGASYRSLDTAPVPPGNPPSLHLYFQKSGDDMRSGGGRWWSNPARIDLAAGGYNFYVNLLPQLWSSVYGKTGDSDGQHRDMFAQASANIARAGFTFGGGNSFGHGVYAVNGGATFTLSDFRLH